MTEADRIAELEKSHAILRGALIFAGRRIRRLTRWRIDQEPSLAVLRDVLRDARIVAKKKTGFRIEFQCLKGTGHRDTRKTFRPVALRVSPELV